MTIISIQFSLSYRVSMDKSFYLVQELKELHSWNEGFSISVFTRVSILSFGLELRVDIVNHCWIEKNLRLLLLLKDCDTLLRMCGNLIFFRRTVFQDWRLVKKSSSIDPETPERAIISVFKSYLVHLGSFKRHIFYFCASIVQKIRSHWGEPYEAKFVVVSVPTNGSNVAFNVVIWLSFLSIKVLQSTIYFWRIFFKR